MTLDQLRLYIRTEATSEQALQALDAYIAAHPADDEALTLRGMRYFSMGRRADAQRDYLEAARLNPAGKGAKALRAYYDVLNYYNKDLYNP